MPQILRLRELGGSVSVGAVVSAKGTLPSQIAFELLAEGGRYSSPSWSVKRHCRIRPVRDQARTAARAVRQATCRDETRVEEEVLHFDVTL